MNNKLRISLSNLILVSNLIIHLVYGTVDNWKIKY